MHDELLDNIHGMSATCAQAIVNTLTEFATEFPTPDDATRDDLIGLVAELALSLRNVGEAFAVIADGARERTDEPLIEWRDQLLAEAEMEAAMEALLAELPLTDPDDPR